MGRISKFFSNLFDTKSAELPLSPELKIQSMGNVFSGSKKNGADLYEGWTYACVTAIKDEVAKIQLLLFKKDKNGNKELISSHPAIATLQYVNPFFTQYDLFERLQANQELQGNEYWHIPTKKNADGLYEIYPLDPTCTWPIADPFKYVIAYRYKIGSKTWDIPASEIIHFKTYNPKSDILGKSTVESVRTSIETDEAAKAYNKQFFENSATPGIVLEYPGQLNKETLERMKQQWDAEYRGFKKAYRTAIAAGGLKIHQMEYKQSDMQFMEQRKFSRDEIAALFRVPLTVLGVLEVTTYAGAKAADYVFARRNIEPKMTKIVNTLNEFYLPLFNEEGLVFEFVSPVTKDVIEQTAYYTAGINNGWLTLNDVRRSERLSELENGDDVFLPFSLSPYSKPVVKKLTAKPGVKIEKSIDLLVSKIMKDVVGETETRIHPKYSNEQFEKVGEAKFKSTTNRLNSFEKRLLKASNDLFAAQKKRALENLNQVKTAYSLSRKHKSIKAKQIEVLDLEKEIGITIDLFGPIFADITKQEGQAALQYLGFDPDDFDVSSRDTAEFLKKNTIKFSTTLNEKTTQELSELIAEGLEEEEAFVELTDRITNYSGFEKYRSERIARTEVIRAQGQAELIAWESTDVVTSAIWYTALDERVDDDCSLLHGKEVDLGGEFMTEDDLTSLGYDIYDGAVDAPPLHPNCRCVLIPVVK